MHKPSGETSGVLEMRMPYRGEKCDLHRSVQASDVKRFTVLGDVVRAANYSHEHVMFAAICLPYGTTHGRACKSWLNDDEGGRVEGGGSTLLESPGDCTGRKPIKHLRISPTR